MENIVYDMQLLEKSAQIGEVMDLLSQCQQKASQAKSYIDGGATYDGKAQPDLSMYYNQLVGHLAALQVCYSIALEYCVDQFLEMSGLDATLAAVMEK